MKNNGIFVTGTDTGIGKTVVSAALLSMLRKNGMDAVPMKPIQTGAIRQSSKKWLSPDLEFCLSITGIHVSDKEKRLMAPYCFSKSCSPHLASAMTRKKIELSKIINRFKELSQRYDMVVVEGAGGVLVPIDKQNTMLDLMIALKLPVVLVARPGLGTINHTILSLRELKRANLSVHGVVINATNSERNGNIEDDNIKTIKRMGDVRILGRLPFIDDIGTEPSQKSDFLKTCEQTLRHPQMIQILNYRSKNE